MKRKFLLILLSLTLNSKSFSQTQAGLQEYYYVNNSSACTVVPVLYYQTKNNWYFEGRHNYEALNATSFYAGKIFDKKAGFSYSFNPVIGVVMGSFKGVSPGMNVKLDYKKYSFSSQSEYTFSTADKRESFVYSWSELSYNVIENVGGGLCLQQTDSYGNNNKLEKGIFIKIKYKKWAFPIYVFKKADSNEKYFVLSLNYEWAYGAILKSRSNKNNLNSLK